MSKVEEKQAKTPTQDEEENEENFVEGPNERIENVPADREKNIKRRKGFHYLLVTLNYTAGSRFGLGIKCNQNQVVVCKVEEGSISAEAMKVLDHILDVSGQPVTDNVVTKNLLIKGLQSKKTVNMVIERPISKEAVQTMENHLNASVMQPPSVALASDVRSIVRRYNARRSTGEIHEPQKGILNKDKEVKGHVEMKEVAPGQVHESLPIGTDQKHRLAELQKVPQKAAPAPKENVIEEKPEEKTPSISSAPGDLELTPRSKIIFNAPYDDKHTYHIKMFNASNKHVGFMVTPSNVKRLEVNPPHGVIAPRDTMLLAVSCDAFNYYEEDTKGDRIAFRWVNAPDKHTKHFQSKWMQGDGMVRRKNVAVEYNI